MKKIIICISILVVIILCASVIMLGNKKDTLTHVKLAEVAHTIFYAPQYIALNEGFFEEEGLEIELILTPGADKVMSAVLSGDVQIGFSGSEATIYVYNGNEKDYVQTFASLTKRDGTFIVSREKIDNFTLDDLKGKTVIGGRKGGMPEMAFEWSLRQNGIDPAKDLTIDTSIAFAAMQGAFIGGNGDFVTLFEPNALSVEKEGFGYVVASVGMLSGEVPYTSYNAKKTYIEDNPEIIEKFTRAIYKGLKFIHDNDETTIAKSIYSQFPDTSMNDLIKIVKRYKDQDAWVTSPVLTEDAFNHLQEIMQASGELTQKVDFKTLVNTSIAEKVIGQ